jgi:hypothetical protein
MSLETDRNYFIFHKVNRELILSVITNKTVPLQFVQIKTAEITDVLIKLV